MESKKKKRKSSEITIVPQEHSEKTLKSFTATKSLCSVVWHEQLKNSKNAKENENVKKTVFFRETEDNGVEFVNCLGTLLYIMQVWLSYLCKSDNKTSDDESQVNVSFVFKSLSSVMIMMIIIDDANLSASLFL